MAYLSDIEIAQRCKPEHIGVIARRAHVDEKYIEQYLSLIHISEPTRRS